MNTQHAMSFEQILTGIRARQNSKAHQAAIAELEQLAKRADELLAPKRVKQRAEAKASGGFDMTPDWCDVLRYFIQGIRNANGRIPQEAVDGMTDNLRDMVAFARGEVGAVEQ